MQSTFLDELIAFTLKNECSLNWCRSVLVCVQENKEG
jgi:hypothetical protein